MMKKCFLFHSFLRSSLFENLIHATDGLFLRVCVCVSCVFRKKAQLKKKRGVPQINEQMLFHGTSSEFVEAICIHNFDWRINGIHGALFGKGNYPNSRSSLSPRRVSSLFKDNCFAFRDLIVINEKLLYKVPGTPSVSEPLKSHFLHIQGVGKTFKPLWDSVAHPVPVIQMG